MASPDSKRQSLWRKMTKKTKFLVKRTKIRCDVARGLFRIEMQLHDNIYQPTDVNQFYFGTYRDYFLARGDIRIARLFQQADQIRDDLGWTEYQFNKIQARRKQALWVAESMAFVKALYRQHADACRKELLAAYWRARAKLQAEMNNNKIEDSIVLDPVYPHFRFHLH